MRKVLGLGAGLLLVIAMMLSSCGAGGESAPELPPAEIVDEIFYGYSIGVPDYFSSKGFELDKGDHYNERVSEIDDQAVLRIIRKYCEIKADEFSGKVMEEFGDIAGLNDPELTTEEAEIGGMPGMKISGTDPDGNEVRAALFLNEDYGSIVAVALKEYSNDTEKEHAYIDDFELIPDSVHTVGPEEHLAHLGYTIDFPDYYERFAPFDEDKGTGYACYAGDAFLDITISSGAGGDSMDRSIDDLEESLRFDDETGVDISVSDEVTKGTGKIRQYSYSFAGMSAGGAGAFIYDTEKDTLISINLMESGFGGSEDFIGDFNKMIEEIAVAGE